MPDAYPTSAPTKWGYCTTDPVAPVGRSISSESGASRAATTLERVMSTDLAGHRATEPGGARDDYRTREALRHRTGHGAVRVAPRRDMSMAQISERHQLALAGGAWRRREVMLPFSPIGVASGQVGRIGRGAEGSSTESAPVATGHDLVDCAKRRFEFLLYIVLALFATFVVPDLLPVCLLGALVPVAYAVSYGGWKRGLTFAVINAGCVLALGAISRFQNAFLYWARLSLALSRTRSSSRHWWSLPFTS